MPAPELISLEEAAEYPCTADERGGAGALYTDREEIINSVLGDGH